LLNIGRDEGISEPQSLEGINTVGHGCSGLVDIYGWMPIAEPEGTHLNDVRLTA
jgi:hypothetical protein